MSQCWGRQLLSFVALINSIIVAYLLINHCLRKISQGLSNTIKSKKTVIYLLILILDTCKFYLTINSCLGLFIDYTFRFLTPILKQQFNMIYLYLQSFCIFFIIYFVMKKASKSLHNKKYWIKLTKKIFTIGILISLALLMWIQIQVIKGYFMKKNLVQKINPDGTIDKKARDDVKKEIEKISCKSPIWLSNSAILFA